MFATELPATYAEIDAAEQELVRLEAVIARARARQVELLRWFDEVKVHRVHASRSMEEWTAAHLDVSPTTARDLLTAVRAAVREDRGDEIAPQVGCSDVTFDRRVAMHNLRAVGATESDMAASFDRDLAGVRRLAAKLRRVTRLDERELVRRRHLTIEPTLGETAWRLSGIAPGCDGQLIARALEQRADAFPAPPAEEREGRGQRMLDALTALAQDHLDGTTSWADGRPGNGSGVTVFVDAGDAAGTTGEVGGIIAAGPRIGPGTIDRVVCEGSAALVGLVGGRPVVTTDRSRWIPPAIRDAVLHRDGGCVIDGCRSRYRLQPHHILRRADGGGHDMDNLVTLCWYHHHVAVHGYGKRLDPDSSPHRRRFLTPGGPDPP
jgi:hypothetical protein